jgi:methylglyoxal synthase
MNIALIANDTKKELMTQFCIAYCGVFGKHSLFSTGSTGRFVAESTGLPVELLYSGTGGVEQISAMLSVDELDLILLFRDGIGGGESEIENDLLRLCDVHCVPYATNIATAEALVHALERGDLDWREIARTDRRKPDLRF